MKDDKLNDIFMHQLGKLKSILQTFSVTSPNQSKIMDDSYMQDFGGFNRDLDTKPLVPQDFDMRYYGLNQDVFNSLILDLRYLDMHYNKWMEEDSSLSGVTNAKLLGPKNKDFKLKAESWMNRTNERKTIKKRNHDHSKQLREYLVALNDYRTDKNLVD